MGTQSSVLGSATKVSGSIGSCIRRHFFTFGVPLGKVSLSFHGAVFETYIHFFRLIWPTRCVYVIARSREP